MKERSGGALRRRLRHGGLRLSQGLLRAAAGQPLPRLQRWGRRLGSLVWLLARGRLPIARRNLALCFPELDAAAREVLLRHHVQALGIGIFETAAAWWGPPQGLRAQTDIHGREHLEQAVAQGRGVLLLGAHFTMQELAVIRLGQDFPIYPVYRRHHDPLQERLVRAARGRHLPALIPSDDMRLAVRLLHQGQIVWYPPDQDFGEYGLGHSVFAPFFGIPAATVNVPWRLARRSGAVLLPYFFRRRSDGRYALELQPPLTPLGADPTALMTRYNQLLEAYIREAPAQYLWVHQRFKTRPDPSEPSPYSAA